MKDLPDMYIVSALSLSDRPWSQTLRSIPHSEPISKDCINVSPTVAAPLARLTTEAGLEISIFGIGGRVVFTKYINSRTHELHMLVVSTKGH